MKPILLNINKFLKMKPILSLSLITLILVFISWHKVNCQIKVSSNNYVGINYDGTPLSRFVINSAGNASYQAYIYNPGSGSGAALETMTDAGSSGSYHMMGHTSHANLGSNNYYYGVGGYAFSSSPLAIGRAYGIYGMAGNASNGYNYAVYGYLYGSNGGAAIYGTTNGDVGISGKYAGYFRGNVRCENTIYAASFQTQSDEKFKTNISDIDEKNLSERFLKINPKIYYLKNLEILQKSKDSTSVTKLYLESDQILSKPKYGVIAQELIEIFPELVYEDNDGNLSIEYNGFIPLMIKIIQNQEEKIKYFEDIINVLQKEVENLKEKNR